MNNNRRHPLLDTALLSSYHFRLYPMRWDIVREIWQLLCSFYGMICWCRANVWLFFFFYVCVRLYQTVWSDAHSRSPRKSHSWTGSPYQLTVIAARAIRFLVKGNNLYRDKAPWATTNWTHHRNCSPKGGCFRRGKSFPSPNNQIQKNNDEIIDLLLSPLI